VLNKQVAAEMRDEFTVKVHRGKGPKMGAKSLADLVAGGLLGYAAPRPDHYTLVE